MTWHAETYQITRFRKMFNWDRCIQLFSEHVFSQIKMSSSLNYLLKLHRNSHHIWFIQFISMFTYGSIFTYDSIQWKVEQYPSLWNTEINKNWNKWKRAPLLVFHKTIWKTLLLNLIKPKVFQWAMIVTFVTKTQQIKTMPSNQFSTPLQL